MVDGCFSTEGAVGTLPILDCSRMHPEFGGDHSLGQPELQAPLEQVIPYGTNVLGIAG